jgi:methyltransferase
MWTDFTILALVTLQRLVELHIAQRNTNRLIANGGVELSSGHYPFMSCSTRLAGNWYIAWGAPAID